MGSIGYAVRAGPFSWSGTSHWTFASILDVWVMIGSTGSYAKTATVLLFVSSGDVELNGKKKKKTTVTVIDTAHY